MRWLINLLLVTTTSVLADINDEKVIKIVTGEYPPWISKSLKHGGFAQHMTSEVFKLAGYDVRYFYYPWARTFKEAQTDKYHATMVWYYSSERERLFYHSDSLYTEEVVFFHLKTTAFSGWQSLDDIGSFRIGATRGYTYTPEFWDAHKNNRLNIIVNSNDVINFNMLIKKRIDLFLSATVAGYSLLLKEFSKEQVEKITFHPRPYFTNTNHLLFFKKRHDSKKLLNIFNDGLRRLKKKGVYGKYYDMLLEGYYTSPE
ncbi:transporter substrate-binding domain-containing protein [Endozoicomonas sp. SM1973]|uniref:Transporter substrate-binding domain-containing protein n=1 Tax=Spartinivicinus marinus TaxID=2994442 RepID=A0A853I5A6_9GAMM|nr:transporter substrate-binding domain-containing protein [Spartinivicinus marinus]MCX4027719.1 transporter substrate-binding domain-containing protein [Spartinivicinus marinus]NYZ68523.1 transporter substrate-binding domain-containing protein [Spartinivicinus marinus]